MLALDHLESANSAADVNPGPLRFVGAHLKPGSLKREFSRRDGELNDAEAGTADLETMNRGWRKKHILVT